MGERCSERASWCRRRRGNDFSREWPLRSKYPPISLVFQAGRGFVNAGFPSCQVPVAEIRSPHKKSKRHLRSLYALTLRVKYTQCYWLEDDRDVPCSSTGPDIPNTLESKLLYDAITKTNIEAVTTRTFHVSISCKA